MTTRITAAIFILSLAAGTARAGIEIRTEPDASERLQLAAREVARYLYLRTGSLPGKIAADGVIVITEKDEALVTEASVRAAAADLRPQQYGLKTTTGEGVKTWWIVGGDDIGALYGAYRFLEHLGVRFYLHQDVVPEADPEFQLPDVDETGKPLFELRGLNPWGAHVEGIDLWDADEYKAVFTQMTKMGMNMMLIHSYCKDAAGNIEPAVWVGLPRDVDEQGRVSFSPTAHYWNTQESNWGYKPKETSRFCFGGVRLFETDRWGADVMGGQFPFPTTPEGRNEVFHRTGERFREAFTFARRLGVKTALGAEGGIVDVKKANLSLKTHGPPVMVTREIRERLKSLGKDPRDPAVLQELYEGIFKRIANTHPLDYYVIHTQEGWYWHGFNRPMFDSFVEEWNLALKAWEKVKPPFDLAVCGWVLGPDFDQAAFDKALPKHVAVSAMSRAYNAPVNGAFARIEGRHKWAIPWIEEDSPILTPQLWAGRVRKDAADALAYGCTGLLALHWRTLINEPAATAAARAGWDQSGWNPEFGKPNPAPPPSTFRPPAAPGGKLADKTDKPKCVPTPRFGWGKGSFPRRGLPVDDLYGDWARANFGPEVAEAAAAIFVAIDNNIPLPSTYKAGLNGQGAGGLGPDSRPWEFVSREYAFADEFANLRPAVRGAANLERFDFWCNQLLYTRATAKARCAWGRLQMESARAVAEKDPVKRKAVFEEKVLPRYRELVASVGEAYRLLLSTVTDIGGIQTVLNWEGHNDLLGIEKTGSAVSKVLGAPLPADAVAPVEYQGEPRLIVPTKRTILEKGESLRLKVIVLDNRPAATAGLRWRPLGRGEFRRIELTHVGRGVYRVCVPAPEADMEYYIEAETAGGESLRWPVTAPQRNQTVVVWETE